MRLIETETGTGCARSGLHRLDGLALHTRGAAQSGPYDEWFSLRVRSYGTATMDMSFSTRHTHSTTRACSMGMESLYTTFGAEVLHYGEVATAH